MYTVYILLGTGKHKYYIGSTDNLSRRIEEHNSGKNFSTKGRGPWKPIYTEIFTSRSEAMHRERVIKSYKGGNGFKKLVG